MPSPAFGVFFEIFAEGVVLTVGVIATAFFAERCLKRSAPLNMTGFLAGIIAVFYSTYALTYWFNGMDGYDCTTLAAVNGTSMSVSNAFTFLHLFVKADASNRTSTLWRRFYRWVGIATTVFNWITLIAVHALLVGKEIDGLDGRRCKFTFELTSFRLKWIAQVINQTFQVVAFVYPLMSHLKGMNTAGPSKSSQVDSVFSTLVKKAIASSGVSLSFNFVVTILAFTKMRDMSNGTSNYIIPVFGLAVLDNAVSLAAIMFAIHLPSFTEVASSDDPRSSVSTKTKTTTSSATV